MYWQKNQKLCKYKKNQSIMRRPGNCSKDDRKKSKIILYIYALQVINRMKGQLVIQWSLKTILKDNDPVSEVTVTFPIPSQQLRHSWRSRFLPSLF